MHCNNSSTTIKRQQYSIKGTDSGVKNCCDNNTQQNGGSINSNIIDEIINYYKTKYEYYYSIKKRLL